MKTLVIIIVAAFSLVGCARFKTIQIDERKAPDGENTKITTTVSASTFFTAKSELTKFNAKQTEGSQSASVGGLGQTTNGTNAVEALRALDSILGKVR